MRVASTPEVLGHAVRAPSTLGTSLRSFTWGHVSQLDGVLGESICRAWSAGAGPGTGPVSLDVDSTVCETYGLAKQGARFGYTHVRALATDPRVPLTALSPPVPDAKQTSAPAGP
jgi:hypothetical protein